MSGAPVLRLVALAAVALAVLVAALRASGPSPKANPVPSKTVAVRPADPRLARCQALGAAGAEDPDCLKAWSEARARFLGLRPERR